MVRPELDFSQSVIQDNLTLLEENPYPGRGIVMGLSENGNSALQVYWVTGTNDNSRNRILVHDKLPDGDIVRTNAFDESKVEDSSLIIYKAMAQIGVAHIVSNGKQTDTIQHHLDHDVLAPVEAALRSETYEPDGPIYTPRISGIVAAVPDLEYVTSIISRDKTGYANYGFGYGRMMQDFEPGTGLCFHTYDGDGNPPPSFSRLPYEVSLGHGVEDTAQTYWDLLNRENRVAIVAKEIYAFRDEFSFHIINDLGE